MSPWAPLEPFQANCQVCARLMSPAPEELGVFPWGGRGSRELLEPDGWTWGLWQPVAVSAGHVCVT